MAQSRGECPKQRTARERCLDPELSPAAPGGGGHSAPGGATCVRLGVLSAPQAHRAPTGTRPSMGSSLGAPGPEPRSMVRGVQMSGGKRDRRRGKG
jgi:hypothetical protein